MTLRLRLRPPGWRVVLLRWAQQDRNVQTFSNMRFELLVTFQLESIGRCLNMDLEFLSGLKISV